MTPPEESRLRLPGGVDGVATRALAALIEKRFGSLPVERVLVWHVESVVEDALPHLAEGLGIADLAFIGAPPRELIAKGVDLMRRRGTGGATEEALAAIGYDGSTVDIDEDTRRYCDGSLIANGEPHNCGYDAEWIRYHVWIDADGLSPEQLRELWDVIRLMGRVTRPFVLIIRASDGVLSVYRSRDDITGPSHMP